MRDSRVKQDLEGFGRGDETASHGSHVLLKECESLNATQSSSSSITECCSSTSPTVSLNDEAKVINEQLEKTRDANNQLPAKRGNKITRCLFHNFFSAYRTSFTTIFVANLSALIALVLIENGTPSAANVGTAASCNFMVAILFRQENFVNLIYEIFVRIPLSLPLTIRRKFAKVFHYGGFHSGCGVAAAVWYFLYTAIATRSLIVNPRSEDAIANVFTSWLLIALIISIIGAAHPRLRVKFHNKFEVVHRFAGWAVLATFWVHIFLDGETSRRAEGITLGLFLVKSPSFWFLCVSTMCIILSWARLRNREVFAEKLSDHATRLYFRYQDIKPFYGVKLSKSPILEWHSFAVIPEEKGFSVLVANAGDWTNEQIMTPSKKLWIRGDPLYGLLYTSRLFKKIVIVATGSGIGPCLSLMFANITPHRVLWSTPNPEISYGSKVVSAVLKADPDAVIWNTRTHGRPDMVALTYQLVIDAQAEAVFIISNPKVTRKVVYGMESRGIGAYGAIFDS